MPVITPIPLTTEDLTQAIVDGEGVFDVLMRANKAHLEEEFSKGRIKGAEYATVYLGSMQQVLTTATQFLLQRYKASLEAEVLAQQIAQIEAQTALLVQQKANAITENTVLVAQECKLRAEYDVLVNTNTKTTQEIALLAQKTATERAQIQALGVEDNSVIGKQKLLYAAQTTGFTRDAEQKAADIMVKTWNTRRMTDEATSANVTNKLDDAAVGRAVDKLLAGVNA